MQFIVIDSNSPSIIGLRTSEDLNLLKRLSNINVNSDIDFYTEYDKCFGKIKLLKHEYKIQLKSDVEPVIHASWCVPIALKDKLRHELDRMKWLDIIEEVPISECSEWVNSMVIVEKPNDGLRICLDPSDLNKATERHHHHLSTTEEILSKLSNGKVFTKLDASCGYWQILVDADNSKLFMFNTPFGQHCFKRMPYGLHSASKVFQGTILTVICGIDNAENSQDNIVVWGKDVHSHNETLKMCLRKLEVTIWNWTNLSVRLQ